MLTELSFDQIKTHEEAQAFFFLSRHVGKTVMEVQSRLAPSGLRLETWAALDVLSRSPQNLSGLAKAIGVSKVSITRWTPQLCEFGYVERTISDGDRRVSLLKITPSGQEVLESAGREVIDAISSS